MIFFRQANSAETKTKDKVVWKKRFALFPTCVSMDHNGLKKYVWLGLYQVRLYHEEEHGWWKEYRLPDSDATWKIDANCYGM